MTTPDSTFAEARAILSDTPSRDALEPLHQLVWDASNEHPQWCEELLLPFVIEHLHKDWHPAFPVAYKADAIHFEDPLSPPWFEYEENEEGGFRAFKPIMQLVRTLYLGDYDAAETPEILGSSPNLCSVVCVDIDTANFCTEGPEALEAFLTSNWASQVRILRIGTYNYAKDEHVLRLAQAPALANLEALSLQHNEELGPASIKAIAESPYLQGVQHLDFKGCFLQRGSGRELLESGLIDRLKTLTLGTPRFCGQELREFWDSPKLSSLEYLSFSEELCVEMGGRPPHLSGELGMKQF